MKAGDWPRVCVFDSHWCSADVFVVFPGFFLQPGLSVSRRKPSFCLEVLCWVGGCAVTSEQAGLVVFWSFPSLATMCIGTSRSITLQ